MKQCRVSRRARNDLDQIWLHIAREVNIETADRFVDDLTNRFPLLAGMPEAGRSREDLEPGLRSFPVEDFLIYYRRARRGILISRVIHGRRDQRSAWAEK